jgi:AcrR family transcriptional regulator
MAVMTQRSRAAGRLPRGPHKLPVDEVVADQRGRMIEAMVHFVLAKGYAATTVADLIGRAGVSRKTFYDLFEDREDLLVAAFEDCSAKTYEDAKAASTRTGGPTRQLEALMRRLSRSSRERPGTIALTTFEIAAANTLGLQLREQLIDQYGSLIVECLIGDGDGAMPKPIAATLAGAAHREIDLYVRAGRLSELSQVALEIANCTRRPYPTPPSIKDDVEPVRPWPWLGANGLVGGRAPGTLALTSRSYVTQLGRQSREFDRYANRERILDAVAQIVAEQGYEALTAEAIADHADLSERAFLAHFKGKDDAFVAAFELGHAKGQAIVERARAGAPDWRSGVRAAVHAFLEFFASEPYFAHLAFVHGPLGGPAMGMRCHEHASAYARLMLEGAPQRRRPPLQAPRMVIHGLFELVYRHAARNRAEDLPRVSQEATFLVLAPFLGVTEAADVAS